jgi:hypothetical protein
VADKSARCPKGFRAFLFLPAILLLALGTGVAERVYLLSLLEMTGVRANCDVRHTQKVVLNHFRDFETIEVLLSHLQKYSLQSFLDVVGCE